MDTEPVVGLIDYRVEELGTEALFLGGQTYAQRPRAFMRSIHRYWKAWGAELRATSSHRPAEPGRDTRRAGTA